MDAGNRLKILVSESNGFAPDSRRELEALGDVTWGDFDLAGLKAAIGEADILWVRLRHFIGADVLEQAPKLKWIVTATTGLNHIDTAAASRRGIEILSLRDAAFLSGIRATAEHTIALALALIRRLPAAVQHVNSGGWDRDRFCGAELYGKTAGIVGYGRLGKIVARSLGAFGCDVLAADPNVVSAEAGVRIVSLAGLLEQSDIVTLHVNLNDDNTSFFGAREFQRMKRGSWFVNTSRGELVDEGALLQALRSERLAGAALDVISGEQRGLEQNALIGFAAAHENLIITPHIGGCTAESMRKTEAHMIKQLQLRVGPAMEVSH
ncbi:MAG TPA: NAD(P)-dependent oxidoreductase [Bryobacteraceae bacterium]|jgi:D-3-phosphoglycerate dehydrogenase